MFDDIFDDGLITREAYAGAIVLWDAYDPNAGLWAATRRITPATRPLAAVTTLPVREPVDLLDYLAQLTAAAA